ncbi:hypothetical protein BJV40_002503 [Clostridium beijerinckii]|nr:hypothetical protein [Clostridium beijerinckii]
MDNFSYGSPYLDSLSEKHNYAQMLHETFDNVIVRKGSEKMERLFIVSAMVLQKYAMLNFQETIVEFMLGFGYMYVSLCLHFTIL